MFPQGATLTEEQQIAQANQAAQAPQVPAAPPTLLETLGNVPPQKANDTFANIIGMLGASMAIGKGNFAPLQGILQGKAQERQRQNSVQTLAKAGQQLPVEQQNLLGTLLQSGDVEGARNQFTKLTEQNIKEQKKAAEIAKQKEAFNSVVGDLIPANQTQTYQKLSDAVGPAQALTQMREIGREKRSIRAEQRSQAASERAQQAFGLSQQRYQQSLQAFDEAQKGRDQKALVDQLGQTEKHLKDTISPAAAQAQFVQSEMGKLMTEKDTPATLHMKIVNSLNKQDHGKVSPEFSSMLKNNIENAFDSAGGKQAGIFFGEAKAPDKQKFIEGVTQGLVSPEAMQQHVQTSNRLKLLQFARENAKSKDPEVQKRVHMILNPQGQ